MIILFGILVGLALGLTGGGGSILAVPLLVYGLGMDVRAAVSTSLAAVALITAFGAVDGLRARLLEVRVALLFAGTGILAAPLGVVLGDRVPEGAIMTSFAVLMALVGGRMFLQARRTPEHAGVVRAGLLQAVDPEGQPMCRYTESGRLRLNAPCSAVLAFAGFVVGLLSGFFGVGGGFLIVPALLLVTQISIHRAVATSLLVISLIGLSGVLAGYFSGREIPWSLTGLFLLGGIAGMALGRRLAARLAGSTLQQLFGAAVVVIGLGIFVASLTADHF